MANLEALWVAGCLAPGGAILASSQAHYTHGRISQVLGLPFESLLVDGRGRIELDALERRLGKGGVACVVATAGTTGLGAVDPVADIRALCDAHGVRLHADAAYGGYFVLAETLGQDTRQALAGLTRSDSIVIDPHKHGLQPYGCGCVLFRDAGVGRFYKHDSPYTYFSSDELHLGEISLECSRAGASAVALWATLERYPLVVGGEFAAGLDACHRAAVALHDWLEASEHWLTLMPPALDIVIWAPARCHALGNLGSLGKGLSQRRRTGSASRKTGPAGAATGGPLGRGGARPGKRDLSARYAHEVGAPRLD